MEHLCNCKHEWNVGGKTYRNYLSDVSHCEQDSNHANVSGIGIYIDALPCLYSVLPNILYGFK